MSFILDALKKSQRERSLGHVPTLQTLHAVPVAGKRKRWPLLLVLLLPVLLLLVYFYRTPLLRLSQQGVENLPPSSSSELNPVSAEADKLTATTVTTAEKNPLPITLHSATRVSTGGSGPLAEARSPIVSDTEQILPERAPSNQTLSSESAALERRLHAELTVNVISWSAKPEQRFVMIDQQIYHENSLLPGGYRIEEITADGVQIRTDVGLVTLSP